MGKLTEVDVESMKPKDVTHLNVNDLTDEAFDFVHDVYEINSCSKCRCLEHTEDLIWISEGFTPFENEQPNEEFFQAWGDCALCDECYHAELDICRDVI